MSGADPVFCVEVRHNVVTAIRAVSRDAVDGPIHDDRLAVSTELARNNLTGGCFDGDYFLEDFETARHFSALCLGFMKVMCEKSLTALENIDSVPGQGWINPHLPDTGRPD